MPESKPVVFLGSGTSMPNVIECLHLLGRPVHGVWDPDYLGQDDLYGLPVLPSNWLDTQPVQQYEFFVATTWMPNRHRIIARNNHKRQELVHEMRSRNLIGATIVHPTAVVSPGAKLGRNVYVGAHTVICHGAHIHDHALIRDQAYVSHGVVIGEDTVVQIKSTITGDVHVGRHCYIGINATVIHRGSYESVMTLGDNVVIHPGLTVLQALPDGAVASLTDRRFRRVF